ncbi:MAG: SDR family oxidoreductase [Bacillota bacterium]|jgi:nucleoside-diphosphate-sugar epimerase
MKVLIIGGTKFMGPYVIEELYQKGHKVAVFNRGQTEASLREDIIRIHGDISEINDHKDELRGFRPDVVLDMIPFTEKHAETVRDIFEGTADRLVAISSADVYLSFGRLLGTEPGEPVPTPSREDSPLREKLYPYRENVSEEHFYYHYDKIPVEKVYMESEKLKGTVLRLPMVYGPGDRQHRLYQYIRRMADKRPYILLDEVHSRWKTCRGYVENVAHAIVAAIENPMAAGKIYNVAENNFSEKEWVGKIAEAMGWQGSIEEVEEGKLPLGMNARQSIDLSSEKIREELGYKKIIPLENGLQKTIEWELENPPEDSASQDVDYDKEDRIMRERKIHKE